LWNHDPFGNGVPGGTFSYDLRFPGQFYDQNAKLHYNYFRDYDPNTGRYIESDPIGLRGGINTYAYAQGNPVKLTDPLGLEENSQDNSANSQGNSLGPWAQLAYDAAGYFPIVSLGQTTINVIKDIDRIFNICPLKTPVGEGGNSSGGSGGAMPATGPSVQPSDQIVPNSIPGSTPVNVPSNVTVGMGNEMGNVDSSPNAGMGLF
jgi:RHS repeat-associated protein